ncbi:MAG: hypothetical protein V2A71_02515 [Candidatus Eisenbacteria bacterium]
MSLKNYDHSVYGPFLGVSDEGSAAAAVRRAAYVSPKARVLRRPSELEIGVALDAERLCAIGEVVVGPEEYADVWLECAGRLLMTTNVSTRVNVRYFKRPPIVTIKEGDFREAMASAETRIAEELKPFRHTPDRKPRPMTVFAAFRKGSRHSRRAQVQLLRTLVRRMKRGGYATRGFHQLGLSVRIGGGRSGRGREDALRAIDLARDAGIREMMVTGKVRPEADEAGSLPGLSQYLADGLHGPVLRHALKRGVRIRPLNAADPATAARGTWSSLNTARSMGFHLGKYGVFPLMLEECEPVIREVQTWCKNWSAAPVFFVDKGIVSSRRVDTKRDVVRGLADWLRMVARNGVSVVLIDTLDKSKGWRLFKVAGDPKGWLGPRQVERLNRLGQKLGVKTLWAGGLTLEHVYEFGKFGVFGIYVTSSAAVSEAVSGVYVHDPQLASVKEPTFEGVFRTKLLLEAGFLVYTLKVSAVKNAALVRSIDERAKAYLEALKGNDPRAAGVSRNELFESVTRGWRRHFRRLGVR